MSVERARKAIKGEKTDRIPLFSLPGHRGFLKRFTGRDPSGETESVMAEAIKRLDIDMLTCTLPENMIINDADPNLYGFGTTVWRNEGSTSADIWGYHPQRDRSPNDPAAMPFEKCYDRFQKALDRDRSIIGDTTLIIGSSYTTCFHFAAEDLNYEEFLMACLEDEERMAGMLDIFEETSGKMLRAWAATDTELMFCHDDIANSNSTSLSPAWLRRNLLPRYKRLFKHFKDRNIPVLFVTDGNFTAIAQDLKEAGAEGFFLDAPCATLEKLIPLCGRDMIYFTGPQPSTVMSKGPADVKAEIKALAEIARDLPRFFFHMPGGFPHNMPTENVEAFYEGCLEYGWR